MMKLEMVQSPRSSARHYERMMMPLCKVEEADSEETVTPMQFSDVNVSLTRVQIPSSNASDENDRKFINIHKESLRFIKAPDNPLRLQGSNSEFSSTKFNIEFSFDCEARCDITLNYFCTKETANSGYIYVPQDPSMNSQTATFESGSNQKFTQESHIFEPSKYLEETLLYSEDKKIIPIVIYCSTGYYGSFQSQAVTAVVEKHAGAFILKVFELNDLQNEVLTPSKRSCQEIVNDSTCKFCRNKLANAFSKNRHEARVHTNKKNLQMNELEEGLKTVAANIDLRHAGNADDGILLNDNDDDDDTYESDHSEEEEDELLNLLFHRPQIAWRKEENDYISQPSSFGGFNRVHEINKHMSPLATFKKIFDHEILLLIMNESNIYAHELMRKGKLKSFKDITQTELMVYLGSVLYMSVKYQEKRSNFWADSMWGDPIIKQQISRARFEEIERALHFYNPITGLYTQQKSILKINGLLQLLKIKFNNFYEPGQKLSLDESMIAWKGRLKFKQYNRSKHTRYGVKLFALTEANTGYYLNFLLYSGSDTPFNSNLGKKLGGANITEQAVCKLIEPYQGKGHRLYMDNYYNSPGLSLFLKAVAKVDSVGTLRINRKEVPIPFAREKVEKGDIISYVGEATSHSILIQKWAPTKKKIVCMITTSHDASTVSCAVSRTVNGINVDSQVKKPSSVVDYNYNMGGVDKVDQMLQPFQVERKRGLRWTSKIFKRFLNITIHNSYVAHKFVNNEDSLSNREFREKIVEEIFMSNYHLRRRPLPPQFSLENNLGIILHLPVAAKQKRRNCYSCPRYHNKKDSKTNFQCKACEKNLCLKCFHEFHVRLLEAVE